jgi:hypothetical protein
MSNQIININISAKECLDLIESHNDILIIQDKNNQVMSVYEKHFQEIKKKDMELSKMQSIINQMEGKISYDQKEYQFNIYCHKEYIYSYRVCTYQREDEKLIVLRPYYGDMLELKEKLTITQIKEEKESLENTIKANDSYRTKVKL